MPELPEVELMTRDLRSWSQERRITAVDLLDRKLQVGDISPVLLEGRALDRVWRRGKYCLAGAGDLTMMLHFRMTGKLLQINASTPKFARATFSFEGDGGVAFVDRRRLGELRVLRTSEVGGFLERRLGPEPWPEPRDADWWRGRVGASRSAIKVALMDQARVAGLGNIAGSEVCFRAGLDPRTPADRLRGHHWQAIGAATRGWIEHTLAAEQGGEIAYVAEARGAPSPFLVYGREGQACPRCGQGLRRIVQARRSTFFCGGCQKRLRRR